MTRERLVEIAKRNLAHHRNGTVDQADDVFRVPSTNYYDPDHWQREIDTVFRRVPLVMGFSAELREPGELQAPSRRWACPSCSRRRGGGAARAFVNMCSHRGAMVVPEGTGSSRRFMCPYHAWTYDGSGDLVGILDRSATSATSTHRARA